MVQQDRIWEASLVTAINEEFDQLKYLIEDSSGSTEKGDIQAQISRLCGLTDLSHNQSIPFSPTIRLQLQELNEIAMGMVRSNIQVAPPSEEHLQNFEHEAAQALFDAIALNFHFLAQAELSKHAIALSKEAFDSLKSYLGSHPEFDMLERLVLVQDYRVMKLAGDKR
ncbi:hypothetical protein [Pseudomonas turukhanskensis]|uniref:Uncharacterized protein n=1 Tax=Pseudomonas turukhanskensis TaxID=1806536 RepID=A0A9W6K6W4_9PSED|nr:hypothetical protein [Pseudomonas turukhanskensis]GLK90007.1 hypothetical protein GCM10017655_30690 [Pseudomonas turukhanskensis]